MNDRSLCLLDNYDIEVLRTRKGRGAILCETDRGLLTWREYSGYKDKVLFQDHLLSLIREKGFLHAETILKNKDGELLSQDNDGTCYILKTYFEGRECNIRDMEECREAVRVLAAFHNTAFAETFLSEAGKPYSEIAEFEKHNRELKRVKKYLKDRGQKTDFELCLMKTYDYFLNLALQITEEAKEFGSETMEGWICHGDFQYHNMIFSQGEMYLINFEKSVQGSRMRDLYLFMRKLLEKNNWSEEIGFDLIRTYKNDHPIEKEEYRRLYYRLAYPEKFWKIVNFYYNSGKAWIPGKNLEKLLKITGQEEEKQRFLKRYRENFGL